MASKIDTNPPFFKLPKELRDQIYHYAWDATRMIYQDKTSKIQLLLIYCTDPFTTFNGLPSWTSISCQVRSESLAQLYETGTLIIANDFPLRPPPKASPPEYAWNNDIGDGTEYPKLCSDTAGRLTPEIIRQVRKWKLPKAQIEWDYRYSNRPCFMSKDLSGFYDPRCCTEYLDMYTKDVDVFVTKLRWLQTLADGQELEMNMFFKPEQSILADLFLSYPSSDNILQSLGVFDVLPKNLGKLQVRLTSELEKQVAIEGERGWDDYDLLDWEEEGGEEERRRDEEKWKEYCELYERCVGLIRETCSKAIKVIVESTGNTSVEEFEVHERNEVGSEVQRTTVAWSFTIAE